MSLDPDMHMILQSTGCLPAPAAARSPSVTPAVVAFALTAVFFLSAMPLRAQTDTLPDDSVVISLEGITVQGSRPTTTVGGASAVQIFMDSLGLPVGASTEDVFREVPALHVRTNSRGQAEVTVRGSESRQVAIFLDGVPLTLGWDARTDISVLPATALQEVSFVRGLSTVLHGPNVLGGVVEMSVARMEDMEVARSATAAVGIDQEGGYGVTATLSRPFATSGGSGLIRAGGGWRDSPGVTLPDGVSEPGSFGDSGRRLNTDVENVDGFVAVRYRSHDGPWGSFTTVAHRAERGIAAELGSEDPRLWRYPDVHRAIVALSAGTGEQVTPLGLGDLEASVGLDLGRTEIRSFETRAYQNVVGSENGDDRTLTLRLLGDHTLGSRTDLRASATFAEISHDEEVDGRERSFKQRLFSVGAETIWRIVDDPSGGIEGLRLSFGGVYDRGTTPETGGLESLGTIEEWGGRAGLSALMDDGSTMLHVGVSRRGRFPSLREAYSEALNRFVPNPELGPEKLVALEGGVTTRVGRGELQVVGFHHDLTDAVRRITFPDGGRQRVNSDELTSTGVEILLSQSLGPVDIGGNATFQSVELTDPLNDVASEPENMPETKGRAWAAVALGQGFRASGEVEYTGTQFCQDPDTGEDVELDDGTWLNGAVTRSWHLDRAGAFGNRLEARVGVDNLTDNALFDQCGLPRAGRMLRLQLRVF